MLYLYVCLDQSALVDILYVCVYVYVYMYVCVRSRELPYQIRTHTHIERERRSERDKMKTFSASFFLIDPSRWTKSSTIHSFCMPRDDDDFVCETRPHLFHMKRKTKRSAIFDHLLLVGHRSSSRFPPWLRKFISTKASSVPSFFFFFLFSSFLFSSSPSSSFSCLLHFLFRLFRIFFFRIFAGCYWTMDMRAYIGGTMPDDLVYWSERDPARDHTHEICHFGRFAYFLFSFFFF